MHRKRQQRIAKRECQTERDRGGDWAMGTGAANEEGSKLKKGAKRRSFLHEVTLTKENNRRRGADLFKKLQELRPRRRPAVWNIREQEPEFQGAKDAGAQELRDAPKQEKMVLGDQGVKKGKLPLGESRFREGEKCSGLRIEKLRRY